MENNSNKVLCSKYIDTEASKEPEDQVSDITIQRTLVTGDGHKHLPKLSDPDISDYHHGIASILKSINIDSLVEEETFSTIKDCSECVQLNFTHLDNKANNIFMCNSAGKDTFVPLFCLLNLSSNCYLRLGMGG